MLLWCLMTFSLRRTGSYLSLSVLRWAYPTGAEIEYTTDGAYRFKWQKKQMGHKHSVLAMIALPHQMDIITNVGVTHFGHRTVRGFAQLVVGDIWVLEETAPSITWGPSSMPSEYKHEILKALDKEKNFDISQHYQVCICVCPYARVCMWLHVHLCVSARL